MAHKLLLDLPDQFETNRLVLRPYRAGDGAAYLAICLRNKTHLLPYEAGNPALNVQTLDDAEILMRQFTGYWVARDAFFLGTWQKTDGAFAAQVYIGPVDWDLPEFEIGYFVDHVHEGRGFVTEAVQAAIA
jgi:ribosomal-protein-serine acetyltransferase